ncbi:MAG: FeoB-associated Cys-rich membrane protein [Succiniclasticum sp.]|jgi:hypothetical protein
MTILASLNIFDWILLAVVAVLAILAVRSMLRKPSGCDSGCSGCPYAGSCQRKAPADKAGKGETRA